MEFSQVAVVFRPCSGLRKVVGLKPSLGVSTGSYVKLVTGKKKKISLA